MEKYNAFILSPRSIPINRATRYPQFSNPIPRRSQVSIDAWENGETRSRGIGRYHAINTRLRHVHSHRDTRRHARVYYHSRIRGIGSGLEIPLTYSIRTYIHDSVQQRNVTIMITRFISTGSKVRSFVRSRHFEISFQWEFSANIRVILRNFERAMDTQHVREKCVSSVRREKSGKKK